MAFTRYSAASKKVLRSDIEDKLTQALSAFRPAVSEKKFEKSVRKAAKMFARRFAKLIIKNKAESADRSANLRRSERLGNGGLSASAQT